jgi:DNA repair photolyase
MAFIVREIDCKSILTRCRIPGVDYALNPYVGCQHGCTYCYAIFMKRFTGHREEWGQFVDVRVNASDVLAAQLARAQAGSITMGTVTDAYQPVERKYGVTRGCLQVLAQRPDFTLTVLTKGDLVLRDLDVLREMKNAEVAFTVTALDEAVRRAFELGAPPTQRRLDALAQLHAAGVRTWAFFGPVLPGFTDGEAAIDAILAALAQVGVDHVLVDTLNGKGGAWWSRLRAALQSTHPDAVEGIQLALRDRIGHARMLEGRVVRAAKRYGLDCRLVFA